MGFVSGVDADQKATLLEHYALKIKRNKPEIGIYYLQVKLK
jgi:hypothetical protein